MSGHFAHFINGAEVNCECRRRRDESPMEVSGGRGSGMNTFGWEGRGEREGGNKVSKKVKTNF